MVHAERARLLRDLESLADEQWEQPSFALGDGPELRGPVVSLLLAISGRQVAVGDLDGPGVADLAVS